MRLYARTDPLLVILQHNAILTLILLFILFVLAINLIFAFIGPIVGEIFLVILALAYVGGVFLPSFAVAVRRLHDLDKSGWWLFLGITLEIWWC